MHNHHSVSPRQEEYRKILCAYHQTEFLTNFCVHKTCLMPLCPSCIVEHTEEHYREPSKPLYMNLHEALHDVKESCLNNIAEFERFAHKLTEMTDFKKSLVQQLHQQLQEHKQSIYLHIQRMFYKFEQEVYDIVVNDYNAEGLYKEDDINQYDFQIKDVIAELYQKISLIKGDQCLPALIMFYGEERERIGEIKAECNAYLLKHDRTKIQTYLDENAMKKQLENLFSNLIEVEKSFVEKPRIYEPLRKSPQKNGINSSLDQSRRSRIFNQSGYKYPQSPNKQKREKITIRDSGQR